MPRMPENKDADPRKILVFLYLQRLPALISSSESKCFHIDNNTYNLIAEYVYDEKVSARDIRAVQNALFAVVENVDFIWKLYESNLNTLYALVSQQAQQRETQESVLKAAHRAPQPEQVTAISLSTLTHILEEFRDRKILKKGQESIATIKRLLLVYKGGNQVSEELIKTAIKQLNRNRL